MRKVLLMTGLVMLFGAVLAIGAPNTAAAQALDEANAIDATEWQADTETMFVEWDWDDAVALRLADEEGRRRRVPPRHRHPLRRVLRAVHRACPCEGPEEGVAWKNHGEFVSCVTDKVNELKDKGLPEKVASKIIERAAKSEIGKPGFVCPVPPERPDRPEPGTPREPRQPGRRGERP